MEIPPQFPTIVSFFGGAQYYYKCADQLRADCQSLGLAHDLREMKVVQGQDWADICRLKPAFCLEMLEAHPEGILWVDVDTRILHRPEFTKSAHYDFGAFLRAFRSLRQHDPMAFGRTFHPGILQFTGTEKSKAFLKLITDLEGQSDLRATDDYFLEEGWRALPAHLSVHVFSPDILAETPEQVTAETVFLFGDSGNVKNFVRHVEQHPAGIFELDRQKRLLRSYIADATRRLRRDEAIIFARKIVQLDPGDKSASVDLAELYLKNRQYDLIRPVLIAAFPDFRFSAAARRLLVERGLAVKDLKQLQTHLDALKADADPTNHDFAASRQFRLDLELRALKLGVTEAERPPLWWMERPFPGNFGDILNPYIVEKLSGIPPRFVLPGAGILAVGSIIKFARTDTLVWGAGTPRMTDVLAADARYLAVRGPMTRDLVLQSGGQVDEIYGDPAMLLPNIYPRRINAVPGRIGLIRHYSHRDRPIANNGIHEIEIRRAGYEGIETFLDEMHSCEAILSTSLHGLIVAHAYGIPTRWCTFADEGAGIPGGDMKFLDHYAAADIKTDGPLDLSQIAVLDESLLTCCTEVVGRPIDTGALLRVAPFPLVDKFRTLAD